MLHEERSGARMGVFSIGYKLRAAMSRQERALSILGLVILAVILALAFRAYLSPAMMIDFATLRICG